MADTATRQTPTPRPPPAETGRHPLMGLRDEVDRLFDSFFPAAFGRSVFDLAPWRPGAFRVMDDMTPQVDVRGLADRYEITAELPGVEAKDVKVTVDQGMLEISGEKHQESTKDEGETHLSERSFGSFSRRFRLPADADPQAIGADFANGVLTVRVPKHENPAKTVQEIEIKAH